MIALALMLAATQPAAGEAELTLDGETTTHELAACEIETEGAMPARILIQDMDVTLNAVKADHMQSLSVIKDNRNWSATRLNNGEGWTDRGELGAEPIVIEWGETIRIEAALASGQSEGEVQAVVVARCA